MRSNGLIAVCATVLAICECGWSAAAGDFGPTRSVGPHAATDEAVDFDPAISTDGSGTWIITWGTNDVALGAQPGKVPAVYSRSTDDGLTWSSAQLVRPEFFDDGAFNPTIATDGLGVWVLGAKRTVNSLRVSRSSDNGVTWTAPVDIVSPPTSGDLAAPSLATDGSGVWVLVWDSTDHLSNTIGGEGDIFFSRSIDNGVTWSAKAVLNSDAATDGRLEYSPDVAAGGNTFVATWSSAPLMIARSTDAGATWGPPQAVGIYGENPSIATDGAGRWIVVWQAGETPEDDRIWYSVSDDDGVSWSAASLLSPYFLQSASYGTFVPSIVAESTDEWTVVFGSGDSFGLGQDFNIMVASTRDGGSTWSSPAILGPRGLHDGGGDEDTPALAYSPDGRKIAVYVSTDSLGGTIGDDRDILYSVAVQDCPGTARNDCKASTEADGSKLILKDGNAGADRLAWTLRHAQSTSDLELGNPAASDAYVACLYEKVGISAGLIAEWDALPGTTCASEPCWRVEPGQVELRDNGLLHGTIKKLRIRGGGDGDASIRLRAAGPALAPPRLPLDASAPVRMQLINLGTSACWEGIHDQAKKNDGVKFVSTSD